LTILLSIFRGIDCSQLPEAFNAVLVFDVGSGKMIHTISGIAVPHALVYRGDNQRLYVTYGGGGAPGGVKVLDGRTYNLIRTSSFSPTPILWPTIQ
jgi:DNA-binding beta-propeller fold protein YncE